MIAERYPNLKEKVGGSNPGCEISSPLDTKLVRLSTISLCSCQPSVSKKRKKEERNEVRNKKNVVGHFYFAKSECQ